MQFHARDAADAIGGTMVGPDVVCDGADFDSRTIRPGQLFVPIEAERDGHDFISAALDRGANAYLTRHEPQGGTAIRVDDTAAALLRLGAWARTRSTDLVVGVTGSVGKTSTKDLATAAVGAGRPVWSNRRSFNNDQGLPVTILDAPDDTEVLIVEMGMRGFGEIARLCEIARPRIGVVTAVAEAHSERVGGVEGVQRAKGELVQALPADGTAVLNADNPAVRAMAAWTTSEVITYGEQPTAEVRLSDVRTDELARPRCWLETPWGGIEVQLAVPGRHMLWNAAAALTVAGLVGVPLADAVSALAAARLSPMRMELTRAPSGVLVLDDSYNANPTSMRAALTSLAELPGTRRIAVLGVMAELDEPERHHRAIAAMARDLEIELVAVGTDLYGRAPTPIDDAAADTSDGDVVLIKGSRVAGLERVARRLLGGG